MKKLLLLILAAFLYTSPAAAQTSVTGRILVGPLSNRPSTCSPSDMWNQTDSPYQSFICGPTNTWTVVNGGATSLLSTDNRWTNNNRFEGPIPGIDITSGMPQGGCSERNGAGLAATMSAASTTVTVTGTFFAAYVNGCGVMIESAGPTSTIVAPTGLSATSHGTGGSTTINYSVVAIDNLEGFSPAGTFSFTTSDTYANLNTRHYNFLKANASATAVMYCFSSDKGLGGVQSWIGCDSQPTYRDQGANHNFDGSTHFPPTFLPTAPPVANGPQALFTTIVSGGGTHTWAVANASSNIAAGTLAIHDISIFLNQAVAIAQQFSGTYGFTGEFAPILIPEGNYTIAHWPFATGFTTEIRGALFNVNLPWKVNGTLDGSHASASGGNFQPANQAYINMSNTSSVVLVTSGASTINSIGVVNLVGPGIRMEEGGSNNILNVSLTNLSTSNSCPLLADGNVIASNFSNNVFTAGTSTTDADGAMCFSMQTSVNADGNLNFTNNWLLEKGIWMDNPARAARSVMISSNFTSLQTENNVDSGAVNVDSGTSAEFSTVSGMYFNFTTQDNTRNSSSNFTTIFCHNPENIGATCSLGMTDLNRGSANSVRMSNPANNTLEQGSFNSTNSGGAWSGSGFSVGNSTGGGFSAIGDVGAIFDGIGNLDPGGNGSPGLTGILPSPYVNSITPSITGGSLAAATYYYKSTGLDSNGGETAVGPETSATVASGSSGSVVLNVLSEMGYQYECYRVYRGTTPGGETGYIGATTVGGLSCTVLGGARTRGYTDTGGTSLTVVTPPVTSKAYWFTMPTDPTVPWYFGIDADTGADFAAPQKPLGIGTRCSGCSAAGVGLDVESGKIKAGKGIVFPEISDLAGVSGSALIWDSSSDHKLKGNNNNGTSSDLALISDFAAPPIIGSTTPTAANFTQINLPEGSTLSGISATDVCYGLTSIHQIGCKLNGGSQVVILNTDGSGVSGHCAQFTSTYEIVDNGGACGSGGTGTVTSVAQTFTGGLISVSGSPITGTGTLALTVAGTSGGIPYFNSASSWASSAALTANLPVIGGGAGVAPTVGSVSGNTTEFATATGVFTSGNCTKTDASHNVIDAGAACGTVTSAAASFTGGLISIGGSPITSTGTLAFTVAGTSGGIPYFSSASTWASSGALTANLPVIGGGAGSAPTVGTRSGNTTKFVTTTGTLTNGDCVSIDASGNFIDFGGLCGGGGGGGTVTSVALAAPTGFTVSGSPVNASGTLTFSMPSGWATGSLLIGTGANTVANIGIGTNLQVLQSNGTTASWQTIATGGTVTTFSASNITTGSQNFATESVSNPGTTPALTFTLANSPAHKFFMNNTAISAAPDYESASEADLPATTVFTDIVNTFGAHLNDFSAATLKLPAAAGFTTSAVSNIGWNTTTNNIQEWNGANVIAGVWGSTPTNGQCVTAGVTASKVTLVPGSCPAGLSFQVNATPLTVQTTVNYQNTTSAGASTINFSNPSAGNVQATIANSAGGGNAVLDCTLTGPATGDIITFDATPKCINATPGTVTNAQTGTTYAVLTTDRNKLILCNEASASLAISLAQANTTGFGSNFSFAVFNEGSFPCTITTTTSTINGGASFTFLPGQQGNIFSDNTNYFATRSGYASGTTASIGGAIIGVGCDTGTVTIQGATTSMVPIVVASTSGAPGAGLTASAQVTSANTITVSVCAPLSLTPTPSTYFVRLMQ